MPLPHDKRDMHKAYTGGMLSIGTIKDKLNENRRRVGSVFIPDYENVRFSRETVTAQDYNIYGANLSNVKMKISIALNYQLEEHTLNKLVVKIGNVFYNIDKSEPFQGRVFLYLVTANEKGGKIYVDA